MEQCSKKCKDSSTGSVEGPIPLSELWSVAHTLNKGDMVHFKWRLKSSNGGKSDPWQEQQGYVRYVILDGGDDPAEGNYCWLKYHLPGEYEKRTVAFPQDGLYDNDEVEYTSLVVVPAKKSSRISKKNESVEDSSPCSEDIEDSDLLQISDSESSVPCGKPSETIADDPRVAMDPEVWPNEIFTPMHFFTLQQYYRDILDDFGYKHPNRTVLEIHVQRMLYEIAMFRGQRSLSSDPKWIASVRDTIGSIDVIRKEKQGYTKAVISELQRCYKSKAEPAWMRAVHQSALQNVKATTHK